MTQKILLYKKLFLASVLFLTACSSSPYIFPNKALVDVTSIREAIQIQTEIDADSEKLPPIGAQWFRVIEGNVPIIVTAPHATKPFREGQYRFSDGGGTAALAKLLNNLAGVTALYTTFSSPSDPNYYDNNAFKDVLQRLIKKHRPVLILDIHGSHAYRPYDVDIGTMGGASLFGNEAIAMNLITALKKEGLVNISYNCFGASKNQTITRFAAANGIPAIQLEISSTWLVPSQNDLAAHRFAQLLQGMVRYIEAEKFKTSITGQARP